MKKLIISIFGSTRKDQITTLSALLLALSTVIEGIAKIKAGDGYSASELWLRLSGIVGGMAIGKTSDLSRSEG